MLDTAIQAWGSLAMETIIAFGVLFNVRQVVVAGHAAVTAAHRADLEAARSFGLRTGFIHRPDEYGPSRRGDTAKAGDFDVGQERRGAVDSVL